MAKPSCRFAFLALTCATFVWGSTTARANALDELRASLNGLWNRQNATQTRAQKAYKRASRLNARAQTLHEKLEATQRTLLATADIARHYDRQRRDTEVDIRQMQRRVKIVSARLERRRALFGQRLAAMQRVGKSGYLEMFLSSRSLDDLAWRNYAFSTLTRRDAELQRGLKDDHALLVSMRNVLANEWNKRYRLAKLADAERARAYRVARQEQGVLQAIYNSRSAQLAYAKAQQRSLDEMRGLIAGLESRRDREVAAIAQREAQARRLARLAGEKRRSRRGILLASADLGDHSGHAHGLSLPVRGRLSSRFGMRVHPITGAFKLHTGDDLAAAHGTPFRAARGGRVLFSGWKTAYGQSVLIDNGNGTTTLYGHASRLKVRAGELVRAGQTIGNVGSTGYSTGPHLHFEVRRHGRPVNPSRFLRGN